MSNDIMDFLTDPATATEGFHGILYGESGCGKTSTLDDDKFKVCDFDLEGGTSVLQGAPNVKRFDIPEIARVKGITRYEVLVELGKAIDAGKMSQFDMVAIDSLTAFEDAVKEYVALKYAPNRKREIQTKFGAMADWGDLKDLIVKTLRWFHSFTKRGDNSIHVLWLAHVGKEKDDITQQVTRALVQLQGSTTPDVVMSVVDGFFYMYNKSVPQDNGEPIIERGIITKPLGIFSAKARQPKRMNPLPAKIVAPVWSDIFHQLGYDRK